MLGVSITLAVVVVAVIVGTLIIARGFVPAMSAIFSGSVFVVILVLYWLRSEKDDGTDDHHHHHG